MPPAPRSPPTCGDFQYVFQDVLLYNSANFQNYTIFFLLQNIIDEINETLILMNSMVYSSFLSVILTAMNKHKGINNSSHRGFPNQKCFYLKRAQLLELKRAQPVRPGPSPSPLGLRFYANPRVQIQELPLFYSSLTEKSFKNIC